MTTTNEAVTALCNSVMVGVASSFRHSGRSIGDIDRAVQIMRAEVCAFLFGDEYANEREAVALRSIHQNVAIASVVAACVAKIASA